MSGYFYAFEDAAECGQEIPQVWTVDEESGEPVLTSGAVLQSTRGVKLTPDVLSEPDPETGEQTIVTPGDMSADYVILTPEEYPDATAFRIIPHGRQGFA